jgi:hypothetical protein
MRVKLDYPQVRAAAEVIAVAAVYILISTNAVSAIDASFLFPANWSAEERSTGGGFLTGAVIQVMLVLLGAYLLGFKDLQRAIAASLAPSTRPGVDHRCIATAIHVATAMLVFLPQPERVWELSGLEPDPIGSSGLPTAGARKSYSAVTCFSAWRARVCPRSLRSSFRQPLRRDPLRLCGETAWAFLSPLVGTFMLGCFYAAAVQSGGGSLKPVICCPHADHRHPAALASSCPVALMPAFHRYRTFAPHRPLLASHRNRPPHHHRSFDLRTFDRVLQQGAAGSRRSRRVARTRPLPHHR